MKQSRHDQSDRVWSMTKSKHDSDVTNSISLVYAETETKLSRPIWSGAVCDENQTG